MTHQAATERTNKQRQSEGKKKLPLITDGEKVTFLKRVCGEGKYTDTLINRLSDISLQITDLLRSLLSV